MCDIFLKLQYTIDHHDINIAYPYRYSFAPNHAFLLLEVIVNIRQFTKAAN